MLSILRCQNESHVVDCASTQFLGYTNPTYSVLVRLLFAVQPAVVRYGKPGVGFETFIERQLPESHDTWKQFQMAAYHSILEIVLSGTKLICI